MSACLLALTSPAQAGAISALMSTLNVNKKDMSDLPRYEKLPLFNPHRTEFTCAYQDQHLPPSDPQAERWFQQALALDNPEVFYNKRDYPKVYQLYTQAAERNHWRAMLNLSALILSDRPGVPEHDPEVAIRWVEKAMKLGVADAYDTMGILHQNGTVRGGDATSAYAFFQRAADMGSPSALYFLGKKMDGAYDDPGGDFWGNAPVATKMLECAFSQGYGDAAAELSFVYTRIETAEAKSRALKILHEGVKLGSAQCANRLFTQFEGMDLADGTNLVGYIDMARSRRYSKLRDALEFYEGRLKLPNLDKVLPLPPAPLPKWDGETKTLIDGAKAVSPTPKSQSGAALEGRESVPYGYAVPSLEQSTLAVSGEHLVPHDGYWLALYGPASEPKTNLHPARGGLPERYQAGERFEASSFAWLSADQVQWHYLGEAYALPPQREDFLSHMAEVGLLRRVDAPAKSIECTGSQSCPRTGIWEARVAGDHPLASIFNRWDQQAFVEGGSAFPSPNARFIEVSPRDVRWTYLGSPNEETAVAGVLKISV
jgi:TPR repeat protein